MNNLPFKALESWSGRTITETVSIQLFFSLGDTSFHLKKPIISGDGDVGGRKTAFFAAY